MRRYIAECRDCSYSNIAREGGKAEDMAQGHGGSTGHIVTVHGPLYEARGHEKWECELCEYTHKRAEMVKTHVDEEHDVTSMFISKVSEDK